MSIREREDPLSLFAEWYAEAQNAGLSEPTAVALATADAEGRPSLRMVLLKSFDTRGFVFYTNAESRKGRELAANPHAALCFYWPPLKRQVRIEGATEKISGAESDAYFASRARDSQLGAWASKQSRPLPSRHALEKEVARYALKFGIGAIPRPDHWGGNRIIPRRMEFWRHGIARMHERLVYERADAEGAWRTMRLFP